MPSARARPGDDLVAALIEEVDREALADRGGRGLPALVIAAIDVDPSGPR